MVMKDKLEKTNHKGGYYLFKKLSFVLIAVTCVSFAIAIPTYIAVQAKKNNMGLAQEETSETSEVVEEEETSEYESYND